MIIVISRTWLLVKMIVMTSVKKGWRWIKLRKKLVSPPPSLSLLMRQMMWTRGWRSLLQPPVSMSKRTVGEISVLKMRCLKRTWIPDVVVGVLFRYCLLLRQKESSFPSLSSYSSWFQTHFCFSSLQSCLVSKNSKGYCSVFRVAFEGEEDELREWNESENEEEDLLFRDIWFKLSLSTLNSSLIIIIWEA